MINEIKNKMIELEDYISKMITKKCFRNDDLIIRKDEFKDFKIYSLVNDLDTEYDDPFFIEDRKEFKDLINEAFKKEIIAEIRVIYKNIFYPNNLCIRRLLNGEYKLLDLLDAFEVVKRKYYLTENIKRETRKEKEVHILISTRLILSKDIIYFHEEIDDRIYRYRLFNFYIDYSKIHRFLEIF